MHVRHLSLIDFRSYPQAEIPLGPGVSTLVGRNGQGKTNVAEALGYLATLGSHRVASDQPLVRFGATQAIVRGAVVRDGRETLVEIEINPGRANRARVNRAPVARPREALGHLRSVLFAPEDLALVKGDPAARRRFLDDLLVQRQPRWAGVRSDYDRILKQRGALLKSAAPVLRRGARGRRPDVRRPDPSRADPSRAEPIPGDVGGPDVSPEGDARASALHTLQVWDGHLAGLGGQLLYARLRLLKDLRGHLDRTYQEVSGGDDSARVSYRASVALDLAATIADGQVPSIEELTAGLGEALIAARASEIERGQCLVGPHRDDVLLTLGELPAKGYASHGESWSFALGLKLAAYELLRTDLGTDPVLVLDDVFAELDSGRRSRLAGLIGDCEQVLITAAVPQDIPASLVGQRLRVAEGAIGPQEPEGTPDE